ncbi:hypothetical protein [Pseudomonas sp. PS02303]|uniref:hypothetical protein n=1 Tax=Pseudomonas sp. PS02303 TaxID=2991429 RepID=UPI00249B8255|nr:hypothetical protein [Pseudomonas sp. PS02303]
MNKENIPAWKQALKTMVFNDNYIIYCFLNDRRDALEAQTKTIEGMAKPIPQETKDFYRYLKEKMDFFDDEIERILKEINQ